MKTRKEKKKEWKKGRRDVNKDWFHRGHNRGRSFLEKQTPCSLPCVSGTNGLWDVSGSGDEPAGTWMEFRLTEEKKQTNKKTISWRIVTPCWKQSNRGQIFAVLWLSWLLVWPWAYTQNIYTQDYSSHRAQQRDRGTSAAADVKHTQCWSVRMLTHCLFEEIIKKKNPAKAIEQNKDRETSAPLASEQYTQIYPDISINISTWIQKQCSGH